METENDLLNLLLKSPNSESIPNIAQELEILREQKGKFKLNIRRK